jgi:hypothetical protein
MAATNCTAAQPEYAIRVVALQRVRAHVSHAVIAHSVGHLARNAVIWDGRTLEDCARKCGLTRYHRWDITPAAAIFPGSAKALVGGAVGQSDRMPRMSRQKIGA